ncbi:fibrinogen-binding adhesin SdrG C-terminal domain-containing protein, partial [Staphylococcus simulans]|uniref:fibrinogen-binding adhesin SdrG C-terminal domain-containing protein n=1 Tax=Staphylococcus simulans TaxID=1286 RepID=UPI001A8D42AA
MKKSKKRLDFLPNKLNKYSIRKFTVGTASILVGATLFLGVNNEVNAEEMIESPKEAAPEESNTGATKEAAPEESNTGVTKEAASEESNTGVTKEAAPEESNTGATKEAAPEESNTGVTKEAASEESNTGVTKEAAPEESNTGATKEAAPEESNTGATKEAAPEESNTGATKEAAPEENNTGATKEAAPEENNTGATKEAAPEESNTGVTKEAAPEESNTSENNSNFNQTFEELNRVASNDEKKEILTNYIATTNGVSREAVLNEIEGLNIDYAKLSDDELLNLLVQDLANKLEQNKGQATSRSVSRFAEPVLKTALDNDISEKGSNVNGQITVNNFKIGENSFDPNHSGSTDISADFSVDGKVNEGDYFTVNIPENVTVNGDINYENLNNIMKVKSLTDNEGNTVATGFYNVNEKVVTYTFTDYVNNRNNIKGNFQLPIWTDRKNTPNSGSYQAEFGIADKKFSTTLNINYSSPIQGINDESGPNISSFITDIDKYSGNNSFKQTIYVNPMGNRLYDSNVKIQGYHTDPNSSSTIIDNNTKFKIYRVLDVNKLNDSYYVDPQDPNLVDITDNFDGWITDNGDNSVSLQFGHIDTAYVITVDGKYDGESDENVKTRVFETNDDAYKVRRAYYWDNENIIKGTGGNAGGDLLKYSLGDYVWEDTNKNGIQDDDEKGISGVHVTLKDNNGNELDYTTTDENGRYQFNNLDNGTYIVEFSTPEG